MASVTHISEGRDTAPHGERLPAQALERIVDLLVIQRQALKERGEAREPLEVNRRQLVYWLQQLAEARRTSHAEAVAS